jgi:hypothetical protein
MLKRNLRIYLAASGKKRNLRIYLAASGKKRNCRHFRISNSLFYL